MRDIINSSLKLFLGGIFVMGLSFAGTNSFEENQESKENLFVCPIVIEDNGLQFNLKTDRKNVGEVLKDLKIHLNQNDILMPASETPISAGTKIIIKRTSELTTQTVLINPPVIIQEDNSLPFRKTKIIDFGEKGEKEQTFLITYENGREAERKLVSEKIIFQPQPKIISKGTKIAIGKTQTGQATWYARGLRNPQALTAASNTFPKKTYLRVTNLENNKQVIVKVNDTGAFGLPRVIDLSSGAFKKLSPLFKGVISVKIEEIL
jgi:hypothetical protein